MPWASPREALVLSADALGLSADSPRTLRDSPQASGPAGPRIAIENIILLRKSHGWVTRMTVNVKVLKTPVSWNVDFYKENYRSLDRKCCKFKDFQKV